MQVGLFLGVVVEVSSKRVALTAVLISIGVVLAPIVYFPIGPTKCYPIQHMINAVAGVLLGPWYAAGIATAIGIIRYTSGFGTIFAFPGGIPGALVVGLVHRYIRRSDYAALTEPIGTVVIGATLSALVFAPLIGRIKPLAFFWTFFAASSIPGCILGFIVIKMLRRAEIAERLVD
ncbi:MAG TPA: energy coupling factor transporter S component ThiW [Candidatus Bathyarchaeota archaeon]|nr:energy coupling factor transporter S component ThiW [Candidatus Bathyarchaeota archaeon]